MSLPTGFRSASDFRLYLSAVALVTTMVSSSAAGDLSSTSSPDGSAFFSASYAPCPRSRWRSFEVGQRGAGVLRQQVDRAVLDRGHVGLAVADVRLLLDLDALGGQRLAVDLGQQLALGEVGGTDGDAAHLGRRGRGPRVVAAELVAPTPTTGQAEHRHPGDRSTDECGSQHESLQCSRQPPAGAGGCCQVHRWFIGQSADPVRPWPETVTRPTRAKSSVEHDGEQGHQQGAGEHLREVAELQPVDHVAAEAAERRRARRSSRSRRSAGWRRADRR